MRFSEKCAFSIGLGIRKSAEHNFENEKVIREKPRGGVRQQRVNTHHAE